MNIPAVCPVMLLAQCNVFPRALLPLHLFEPRYCAMLEEVLKSHRMFCVGTLHPAAAGSGIEEIEGRNEPDERIDPYSTAGLVRACVRNADGTWHLMLQGVQRVRILSWEQREPYRLARVEPVFTLDPEPGRSRSLAESVLQSVLAMIPPDSPLGRQIRRQLKDLDNPEILADFVASNFLPDALERQPLLGMESVTERLAYLHRHLPAPAGSGEK